MTSQAGLINLNKVNTKLTFHLNDDPMRYTNLNLPFLLWFMLYNGLYDCLMCPACNITSWVREGKQYPEPWKEPTTEMYVAPKPFGIKT